MTPWALFLRVEALMPDPYLLEIELPEESQRDLGQILHALGLSGERGEDLGEAIGAALSTEALLLRETTMPGTKIFVVDKNGNQREVLLREKAETDDARRPDSH